MFIKVFTSFSKKKPYFIKNCLRLITQQTGKITNDLVIKALFY